MQKKVVKYTRKLLNMQKNGLHSKTKIINNNYSGKMKKNAEKKFMNLFI